MDKLIKNKNLETLERSLEDDLVRNESASTNGQKFIGDIDMRIARDGTWYFQGSPIQRKKLVRLFASVLTRDEAGDFWLQTPAERCRITVDDAPFLAVEMVVENVGVNQSLTFRTNVDDIVIAGPNNPIRVGAVKKTGEPLPYICVRDGIEALITRAVFYDLVELGIAKSKKGTTALGVWSEGVFFCLGNLEEDLS
tara:strand:- start:1320 stop:1907 length:588 start_codon:yes stop_codon:yes gene_type:complete